MKTSFAVEWRMGQAWLPKPEANWKPAVVRAGWTARGLRVEAELDDLDVFNPARDFNEVAYTQGDVFEIFVRPEAQEAYFEIHITPENQVLQLRFANAAAIEKLRDNGLGKDLLAPHKVWQPRIASETRVDVAQAKWIVRAEVPFALALEKGPMKPGERWFCSFCRYDYTRGERQPVLSSTSPHAKCNFHRQQEWRPIVFPGA